MRLSYIFTALNLILKSISLVIFLPAFVAIYYRDWTSIIPFFAASIIALIFSFIFKTNSKSFESLNDIKKECITLIRSGKDSWHYIIIEKIVGDFVYFYDPLFVRLRKKKLKKFVERWSCICLFYTKV